MKAEQIKAKLSDGALASLANLTVDFLLKSPVSELLDPDWATDQILNTVTTVLSGDGTEAWMRERIHELRKQVPPGHLGNHAPTEVTDPLRAVLVRPMMPDRPMIGRLLHHETIDHVFKDVLVSALQNFAKRIRTNAPAPPKSLGRFKALGQGVKGLSEGVLGGLSQEIEQRAEQRINEYVESVIYRVVDEVADHLCAGKNATMWGEYRGHLLDTILTTPNVVLAGEIDKLDIDYLVHTGTAISRALAHRDGLRDELHGWVKLAISGAEGRSVADFIAEAGLDITSWRASVEEMIVTQGKALLQTQAFDEWLQELVEG